MVSCVSFFGCPVRGEKKDLKSKYHSRFAAIIAQDAAPVEPPFSFSASPRGARQFAESGKISAAGLAAGGKIW